MIAAFVVALYPCYVCIPIEPPCGSYSNVTTQTEATIPSNRSRTKLGVGERTAITLSPAPECTVTWSVSGGGTVSPTTGPSTTFTAHDRASNPVITATMEGNWKSVTYNVVEPSGVVMELAAGWGIFHTQGMASVGFRAQPYITPEDVSFMNIRIREGTAVGVGTGYWQPSNGIVHADGTFVPVVSGTSTHPSQVSSFDQVSNQGPPPFADGGVFSWDIPWIFDVNGGSEKQFVIVHHVAVTDATGRTTLAKGGVSVTREANDPTTGY